MQWLKLQQDTKIQIKEIYKAISYTSLQSDRQTENYAPYYIGLGDSILSQYYSGNYKRMNELCDIALGIGRMDLNAKVCTALHRPKTEWTKVPVRNVSVSRMAKYRRKTGAKPKDTPIGDNTNAV